MRAIMVMFDTLTRKFLPNYGNDWVIAPNFRRLAEHCIRFDNFYAGSLPCMPARRELHTGKYNFLHRSWGPLEPFDRSVMELLQAQGIYTHLCTDHSHYWEDGGSTYHNRYSSWEGFRGQEGDHYVPRDVQAEIPERHVLNKEGWPVNQHFRNRLRQQTEEEMSGSRTVAAGLSFLQEHQDMDNWFLQIECFDPHEPFYVPQKYRTLYGLPKEETVNWPRYGMLPEGDYRRDLENASKEYAALLTMCDAHLGKILDFMDAHDMWKDTALIVNTDHGFLLGEHECLGKNFPPVYDELAHIPFFLYVPQMAEDRQGRRQTADESGREAQRDSDGYHCDRLAATVDIAPTLLELFECDMAALGETDGCSLLSIVLEDRQIHETVLFGVHGGYTCCSDGRVVYMKSNAAPENQPLYEYTMMPANMRGFFSEEQLKAAEIVPGSRFSNGLPCMRMPVFRTPFAADKYGDRLYDLNDDPGELHDILNEENAAVWNENLRAALKRAGAPTEEYKRLGI